MPSTPNPPPRRPGRWAWFTLLLVLGGNYVIMRLLLPSPEQAITIRYTTFKEQVSEANVDAIYSKGASIEGRFKKPVTWPPPGSKEATAARQNKGFARLIKESGPRTAKTFTTTLPAFVDPGLEAFLIQHKVEISASPIQSGSRGSTPGRWTTGRRTVLRGRVALPAAR